LSEERGAENPITRLIKPESATAPLVLIPAEHEQLRATRKARRRLNRRQWMISATLVISEVLLALVLWKAASTLQGVWGRGALSEISIAAMLPVTTAWVGLRVFLGMYPGYGLDAVEQLRRHTHATFATLALLAISAVSFQIDTLSRLLFALVF
jgi:hypothetical protein